MTADNDIVKVARRDAARYHPAATRLIRDLAAEIVRLRGEVSKIDAWVRERLPESFHGMAALDVMRLILEGGIAAEQDLLDTAAIAPEETSVVGGFDHRLADMLLGILNDIQNELGFTDEEKECANGSAEIVAAIRELKERATLQPAGGEAVAPFGWAVFDEAGRYMTTALTEKRRDALLDSQDAVLPQWTAQALYTTPPAPVQAAPQEGEALARKFHDTYERLAPSFGYETRQETRQFDPETPNGRLMIAVCAELAAHPSACELGAVQIDDAMIQRGCDAYSAKRMEETGEGESYPEGMQAALTAALQHRGDSQEVGRE